MEKVGIFFYCTAISLSFPLLHPSASLVGAATWGLTCSFTTGKREVPLLAEVRRNMAKHEVYDRCFIGNMKWKIITKVRREELDDHHVKTIEMGYLACCGEFPKFLSRYQDFLMIIFPLSCLF